jgi:tetratricopeptide (TPR) repeat protein
VLNQMNLGLAALSAGQMDMARAALDDVLTQIEMTHAGTEQAAKARSLWYEEGSKVFKGEPYERAMAYYYRGIIYLKERDFDNARACFSSGILQDSFAEEEQNRSDFAVLDLMMAYACHLQGASRSSGRTSPSRTGTTSCWPSSRPARARASSRTASATTR